MKNEPPRLAMSQARWKVFELIKDHFADYIASISPDEIERMNRSIIDELGSASAQRYIPQNQNVHAGQLMYCFFDIMTELQYLEKHELLIKRNPYRKDISDADYVCLLAQSFDEACYVIHERLRRVFNLLKKRDLASEQLQKIVAGIFVSPRSRRQREETLFDLILGERGSHIHEVSVDRPAVRRLGLLELFEKIDDPLGMLARLKFDLISEERAP